MNATIEPRKCPLYGDWRATIVRHDLAVIGLVEGATKAEAVKRATALAMALGVEVRP